MQLRPLDLPAPGGAGDQQVRRGGQVEEHRPAGDVFADGDVERMGRCLGFGRRHDVAETDQLTGVVGHLDTDRRASWNGSENSNVGGRHGVGDVAVETGDPGDLDTRAQLELVARDGGTDRLAEQVGLDTVR